jgi:hypothetical protein
VRLKETAPAGASSVLQVPSVHIIEGVDVQIVARDESNCRNRSDPSSKEKNIADRNFARESTHESAVELVVIAHWAPRASIAGTN